ncbi:hypothetical protein NL676_029364 [Syzygium grande]|nr:hypothetical protein NL676_029364 [Syzygium grande]
MESKRLPSWLTRRQRGSVPVAGRLGRGWPGKLPAAASDRQHGQDRRERSAIGRLGVASNGDGKWGAPCGSVRTGDNKQLAYAVS